MGFGQITLSFYSITNQINQYKNIVNTVISRKSIIWIWKFLGWTKYCLSLPIIIDSSVVELLRLKRILFLKKWYWKRSKQIYFYFCYKKNDE